MPTHDERKSLKNEPLPDNYPDDYHNDTLFADVERQHLAEQGIVQPCMGQIPGYTLGASAGVSSTNKSEALVQSNLPTLLLSMDEQIEAVEARLAKMRSRREEILQKALAMGCLADSGAVIIVREKNLPRKINIDAFKRLQPGIFALAQSTQRTALLEEVKRKLDCYTSKEFESEVLPVTIGLLQSLKTPENVIDDICYPHEIRTAYEVRRMGKKITPESE
jgi:hypothetical protein